jgi:hypothetical protein
MQTRSDGLKIKVPQNQFKTASHEYSLNFPPLFAKEKSQFSLSKIIRRQCFGKTIFLYLGKQKKNCPEKFPLVNSNLGDNLLATAPVHIKITSLFLTLN